MNSSIQNDHHIIQDFIPNFRLNEDNPQSKRDIADFNPPMIVGENNNDEVTKLTQDQSQKFFYQQFLD